TLVDACVRIVVIGLAAHFRHGGNAEFTAGKVGQGAIDAEVESLHPGTVPLRTASREAGVLRWRQRCVELARVGRIDGKSFAQVVLRAGLRTEKVGVQPAQESKAALVVEIFGD